MSKLSTKQQAFCTNLVFEKMSQTEAYIAAGYSPRGANVNASNLIAKHSIKAEVEKLQKEKKDRAHFKKDQALNRLAFIAENGEHHNSIAAIRELGKMLDWYSPDKVEHSVNEETAQILQLMREGRK